MSPAPSKVLVVEDEAVLRASIVAGLAKLRDTAVLGAGTLGEALKHLEGVELVISDIDLPDGLGVQLIGELAKRNLQVPIVFITAFRSAYGALIPPHAGVTLMEKPVSLDALREIVTSRLRADGTPSPFTVADYVQLSCMGRHSVVIDVEWRDGTGRISVVRGELWSADDPSGSGEEAFRRLAFRRDVSIRCHASDGPAGARNVEQPWEGVLMDSARHFDEEQRNSASGLAAADVDVDVDAVFDLAELGEPGPRAPEPEAEVKAAPRRPRPDTTGPTLPSMTAVDPRLAAKPDPFDTLYDEALAALLAKDYRAAAPLLEQARALRPDDTRVVANLKRLAAIGFASGERRES